jgi:SAM-dependent methyltransferase
MIRPDRFMQYLQLFLSAVRRRGILMTARIAYHEIFFDWRYGTETKEYIEAKDIQTESRNAAEGHKYGPLQIPFFWRVFGEKGPVSDMTCYIDFGSGKGRTLLLAALCGFRKVIGVEYSDHLCDVCRRNIDNFTARVSGIQTTFEVVHADAADYAIPDHASTLVFYDPFSPAIFKDVIRNVQASLFRVPRDIRIVVFNCSEEYKAVLSGFEKVVEYSADRTLVYTYTPGRQATSQKAAGSS